MKKSIGIIAAAVLTTSVFSQSGAYDPAKPHSSSSGKQSDSSVQVDSDAQIESSSPGRAEFDAQSSLRVQHEDGSPETTVTQGLTLDDSEAADVLRNSDDPDLANRNHEEGLTDPDQGLRGNNDGGDGSASSDQFLLITPEDVGGPADSESGVSSSPDDMPEIAPDFPASGELDNNDPLISSDPEVREAGELNESRIYNGTDYSQNDVGGPASSESGAAKSGHDDDCEVSNKGSAPSPETGTERSESAVDEHESYRINRSESDDKYHINREDSNESEASRSSEAEPDTSASGESSSTTPPDL